MTKFEELYLTHAGLEMVCDTGLARITFTRAVTGSGLHESKEDILEMTQLKDQKQEFALEGFTKGEDNTVNVKFKVRNTGLSEAYQLSEIGIYAQGDDGEEKLYCVAYAEDGNTETVPAEDSNSIEYSILFNIETVVSADANVDVIYSEDHTWVTEYVGGILGEVNVQADGTVAQQIEALKNEIRTTNNEVYQQSTDYIDQKIADLINGAPNTLDTIGEIAEAMQDNSDVVAALEAAIGSKANAAEMDTMLNQLSANKVDKVSGKGLSSNDYTTAEKNKLSGIASEADVNVQSDWDETDPTSDAFIKNKPTSLPASDVPAWAKADTKPIYTKSEVGLDNVPNVSTDDQTPTFSQATTRTNITPGEKLSIILGKIKKWFADLKTVAFSGSYNDLSDTPTIFVKSGSGAKAGLVPSPGTTAGTSKFLREDGTWQEPPTDADTLDGKHASEFLPANGNAVSATKLKTHKAHISLAAVNYEPTDEMYIQIAELEIDNSKTTLQMEMTLFMQPVFWSEYSSTVPYIINICLYGWKSNSGIKFDTDYSIGGICTHDGNKKYKKIYFVETPENSQNNNKYRLYAALDDYVLGWDTTILHKKNDNCDFIFVDNTNITEYRNLINEIEADDIWYTYPGAGSLDLHSIYRLENLNNYIMIPSPTNLNRSFRPYDTSIQLDIGVSNVKWRNIYATNGTIQTSDLNEKNTVEDLTAEQSLSLLMGLVSKTYKMNNGTSGRTHWGLISQDIEKLLEELGWSSLDFGGFIKSPKTIIVEEDEEYETTVENGETITKTRKVQKEQVVEGEYVYSLRYDEFIAPIVKVVQMQQAKIESLEQRMENLETLMANLSTK